MQVGADRGILLSIALRERAVDTAYEALPAPAEFQLARAALGAGEGNRTPSNPLIPLENLRRVHHEVTQPHHATSVCFRAGRYLHSISGSFNRQGSLDCSKPFDVGCVVALPHRSVMAQARTAHTVHVVQSSDLSSRLGAPVKGKRKYLSEFAVGLFSARWLMMPANQVSSDGTMGPKYAEVSKRCHIYLICARPSMSYDASSFSFVNGTLSVDMIYRKKGDAVRIPYRGPFPLYDGAVALRVSDYPHRELHTLDADGQIVRFMPAHALAVQMGAHFPDEALRNLEVLYVGQAYADGNRSAHDRLRSHGTLQKILADIQYSRPDDEAWVLMFEYGPYQVISSFDGMAKGTIDGPEDSARFHSIFDNPLTEHQRICLAEAGLIRYFKPSYNEIYKESFPSNNQKILAACFELDFSGLAVEINTDELSFNLCSGVVRPREHHLAQFDLVDRGQRASFFSITDNNGVVHTPEEIIALNQKS
jgi:hypothetical protein